MWPFKGVSIAAAGLGEEGCLFNTGDLAIQHFDLLNLVVCY